MCDAGQATDDNKIRRMRIACCITKAINRYSEYVILIALPQKQWFHERASFLRYMYSACILNITFIMFLGKYTFYRRKQ